MPVLFRWYKYMKCKAKTVEEIQALLIITTDNGTLGPPDTVMVCGVPRNFALGRGDGFNKFS